MPIRKTKTENRQNGLGGSEIAAIVGVNPYAGPYDVFMEKVGMAPPKEETAAMRFGKRMESVVVDRYDEITGRRSYAASLSIHRRYPFARGTPDRISSKRGEDERIIEAKTAGWRQEYRWGAEGTDEIPDEYLCQCQWYLELREMEICDVPVLIEGDETRDIRIYRVRRDQELAETLLEAAAKFWTDYVIPRKPPPLDGSAGAKQYLRARYPNNALPELVTAGPELEAWAKDLISTRAQLAEMEKREALARQRIEAAIGEMSGLVGNFGQITFKRSKASSKVDWEALARELGVSQQQIEEFTRAVPGSRRFLVRPAKFTPTEE